MTANGVDSSMHNQPCAIMLFTAFYNDLPRRATTRQPSPARRTQAKFQEIRRTQHTLSRMQSTARRDCDWTHGRQRCVNAPLLHPHLSASLSSSPLDPRWRSVRRIFTLPAWYYEWLSWDQQTRRRLHWMQRSVGGKQHCVSCVDLLQISSIQAFIIRTADARLP